jgi:hypothetical protein
VRACLRADFELNNPLN